MMLLRVFFQPNSDLCTRHVFLQPKSRLCVSLPVLGCFRGLSASSKCTKMEKYPSKKVDGCVSRKYTSSLRWCILSTCTLPMRFPAWPSPAQTGGNIAFSAIMVDLPCCFYYVTAKVTSSMTSLPIVGWPGTGFWKFKPLFWVLPTSYKMTSARFGADRPVDSRGVVEQTYAQKTQIVV